MCIKCIFFTSSSSVRPSCSSRRNNTLFSWIVPCDFVDLLYSLWFSFMLVYIKYLITSKLKILFIWRTLSTIFLILHYVFILKLSGYLIFFQTVATLAWKKFYCRHIHCDADGEGFKINTMWGWQGRRNRRTEEVYWGLTNESILMLLKKVKQKLK